MTANVLISWNESYVCSVINIAITINNVTVESFTTCDVEEVGKTYNVDLITNPIAEVTYEVNDNIIALPQMLNAKHDTCALFDKSYFNL